MSATTCLSTSIPEPAAPAEAAPAEAALIAAGVPYRLVRHRRVGSLAEAAALRGVRAADLIKTIVVRRGEADYLFVLVPGDREIAWPTLRAYLGVNRASMPDAATALEVTGYERGTITPFGASTAWPVIADATISGRSISLGAGEHGASVTVNADTALAALGAQLADVTEPVE